MDEGWLTENTITGRLCKYWNDAVSFIERYTNLTKEGAEAVSVVLLGIGLYEAAQGFARLASKYESQIYTILLWQ